MSYAVTGRRLASLLLLGSILIASGPAEAAESTTDNPLKKASVGDWVEFAGSAPSVGIKSTPIPMTLRYTVVDKTDDEVTLTVQAAAGELELPERQIRLPLTQSLDLAVISPSQSDRVAVTLEKAVPDRKLKIRGREFTGTVYHYKVAFNLFEGLGFPQQAAEAPSAKSDAGKLETKLSYFLTPDAPVLGIAAISMSGVSRIEYELYDGTGVAEAEAAAAKAARIKGKVGDWIEYRGTEKSGDQEIVLRHTVRAVDNESMTIAATLTRDGQESTWDFQYPPHAPSELVPRLAILNGIEMAKRRLPLKPSRDGTARVLDDVRIKVKYHNETFEIPAEPKRLVLEVQFGRHRKVPLTGAAVITLKCEQANLDLALRLSASSEPIELEPLIEPKSKSKPAVKARKPARSK